MAAARRLDTVDSNVKDEFAVLLVHTEYGADKVGSSFLHRQVAEVVKEREPDIPVFSTVLQATEKDKQDAKEDGVELLLPHVQPGDTRTDPTSAWLTFDYRSKYPNLPSKVRSIVGHADVTSRAALNIKVDRCKEAKVVLIYNEISENTQRNESFKAAAAVDNAQEADVVFSVGHKVFDHFENQFRAIPDGKQPKHFKFLPRPSKKFEHTKASYKYTETMAVLSIGRVKNIHDLKGHDLVAKALDIVAKALGIVAVKRNMECCIRGINEEDFQASDKDFLKTHLKTTHLKPTLLPYGTLTDLHNDMLKAHLVLIPSETEPFELAGLDAIAAGIPVLVSDKSGLADLMAKISPEFCYSVVNIEGDEQDKVKQWAKRIGQSLSNCETEFERAARCRDKLLSAKYWEESHQQLISSCIQTEIKDLDLAFAGDCTGSMSSYIAEAKKTIVSSMRVTTSPEHVVDGIQSVIEQVKAEFCTLDENALTTIVHDRLSRKGINVDELVYSGSSIEPLSSSGRVISNSSTVGDIRRDWGSASLERAEDDATVSVVSAPVTVDRVEREVRKLALGNPDIVKLT